LISAARKIAFFSETVRTQSDKLGGLEMEIQMARRHRPRGKTEVAFGALTPEQNKIIFSKSSEHKYFDYVLQGPFEETLVGKVRGVYKGIYRDGCKDIWGKMRLEDGTYLEGQWRNGGELFGKVLVVKPNGVYFEGHLQDNEQFRGYFRNPALKRQSRLDKDPGCSKRLSYGVNEEGYVVLNNGHRYKGMLSDSNIR